ncbi:ABC transporter substrate-binding protein [Reinekea sp. G2M2-21]|uniref:substrate-binding periplasmic protein n=1 Tax=Reinekea sp. G2M2-21 TaxID=2788942 RepID=UPI0018AA242C|nr:transporter substrate-binding domain-containing protein [Reinekea sp. G2M2-21]
MTPISALFAADRPDKIIWATHDQDWYPIDYRDDNGEFVGIFEEIFSELFVTRLDLDVEIRRQPWKRSQAEVENGLADILITLPTDERRVYAETVPTPFFNIEFNLLVKKNHPKLSAIEAIKNVEDIYDTDLTLVSTYGNGWYESTVKAVGIKTEYVKTDEQQIRFLLANRADALIDFPLTMKPLLERLDTQHQLMFTETVFSRNSLHIMVSKKSMWINHQDEINAALQDMQHDPKFSASQRIQ